jgi:uncharacterized protein (TIGR02466 family)
MTAVLNRAVQLFQQGSFLEADQVLAGQLSTQPDDVEALHLRGIIRGKLGQFAAGAADLEAAAPRHPMPHAVYSNLGNLWRAGGDAERALAAYEQAHQLAPTFLDAYSNKAVCLTEMGRDEQAADAYLKAIEIDGGHLASLNGLGALRVQQNRLDEAMGLFDQALAANPDAAVVLVNRGCLFKILGQGVAARADLERAAVLAPGLAEAQFQLASVLRMAGEHDRARQTYYSAVRASPFRADIHRDLASHCWELGQGDASTAVLEEALQRSPSADLHCAHAEILMRTGRVPAAIQAAQDAVAFESGHARSLALLGELLVKGDSPLEGLSSLRAAMKAQAEAGGERRGNFAIRHQLVEALLAQGGAAEALELLEPEPNQEYLQKHVALKSLAWRVSGDERYRRYYDYEQFTRRMQIDTPPGYDSLEAFNAELAQVLEDLHKTKAQPLDQTLFGGTQSDGRLWDTDNPVILALSESLMTAARQFVAELPHDETHPFLKQKHGELELAGAWSVRLSSGGGHVDHVHPAGWISACYYVDVPQSVMAGEKSGWLRLGASGVTGLELAAERYLKPEPGVVLFFPSYMWHGVEPFESEEVRVTAPFDLVTR